MFYKSIGIDLDEMGAAGIHIANCGGIWQALIMGFAGVSNSLEGDVLEVNPRLPEGISRLKFNIFFKGAWYGVDVSHDGAVVNKNEVLSRISGRKD